MNHRGGAFCGAALASAYAASASSTRSAMMPRPTPPRSASESDDHIQLLFDMSASSELAERDTQHRLDRGGLERDVGHALAQLAHLELAEGGATLGRHPHRERRAQERARRERQQVA